MRNKQTGEKLSVRAISGSHVVVLAWDLKREKFDTHDLLGFAIERTELQGAAVKERYFLRGIKRFEDKDKGLAAGTPVPTSEHPVQSFQWGDYTAKPSTKYKYRVVPAAGAPKALTLRDDAAVSVDIETEPLYGRKHSIFFNRGVAGSQAYARQFQDPTPDTNDPESPQMAWLSRGLYEALIDFIAQAKDNSYGLRAALYEFHFGPVGEAFNAAVKRGADVKVLYDEPNYGEDNFKMISTKGLSRVCAPRKSGGAQKHNKFIVLLREGNPVEVWTGSTNISDGGIFGHSNVGHIVHDFKVAGRYLAYWNALCNPIAPPPAASSPFSDTRTDPGKSLLTDKNEIATPTPVGNPPANSIGALFSPRDGGTLQWYADRMAKSKEIVCFTVAFTLAEVFEPFLEADNNVLRFVLSDKRLKQGDLITRDRDVVYAAGAKFGKNSLPHFLEEKLTDLNHNLYIHDKFMLIDPLGDDPTVITGSANFSPTSQISNDENMLVIRSDRRVADVYFGEFMRIFDHLYARYLARKFEEANKKKGKKAVKGSSGYLRPDSSWVDDHFGAGPKSRRRRYFHGGWKSEGV
ncbi:MAG TPA: phospholipase D-like domain-containing protein [Bacteroidota bacterium]|jgi:phosphatidylserine/phosphatidylglycerophosphate/cardiolipin synthase-like enzyme|nr:phospholipase D-like domain-containing protein [Bacteroidota bacterium]